MRLCSIPPQRPFLDVLAARCLAQAGPDPLALSRMLVLLPTRRAARGLADAFLRQVDAAPGGSPGGRALLLPRIAALGAPEEAPLTGTTGLAPSIEPAERLAILTRLILALGGRHGAPVTADRAWPLAAELAALLDEAQRAEVDLAARLPEAAEVAFAEHWQVTVTFLQIVTRQWPGILAERGLLDPAERQVRLLHAQAEAWRARPPATPVIAAGTTGAIPAVARLLAVVAGLPAGLVVLPGLDRAMAEPDWQRLDHGHPQAGMQRLLAELGQRREDVPEWDAPEPTAGEPQAAAANARDRTRIPAAVPAGRVATLRTALLPAGGLDAWRTQIAAAPAMALETAGLWRLRPADQQEEAAAIALVLRDALERPGRRAALVTPDRELAARVTGELLRFGVVADDSAGEPLAQTPPAVFLRLLIRAVTERLAPVPLLALLKHPLCAAGLAPVACRLAARQLELACLRGPRPGPDVAGLREAIEAAADAALARAPEPQQDRLRRQAHATLGFLERVQARLAPLLVLAGTPHPAEHPAAHPAAPPAASPATPLAASPATPLAASPADALAALIAAAEAMAASDADPGAERLWSGEDGAALSEHLARLAAALPALPPQPPRTLPGLLDAALEGAVVRSRRALRGRAQDGSVTEHPRLFIWGLLESRLQSVDLMVLGGLSEGVWPTACDPGPWMSRAMRTRVGLPSPEEAVGEAAHDFVAACCAAPEVVLSCPARRDGAPAVPARWLVRLEALLQGARRDGHAPDASHASDASHGAALPGHPAADWARALDRPHGDPVPVLPPAPRPPVAARPRRLSVTEIETWLRDPYAIYARHVLRLRALDPIEQSADAADYGLVVHDGLHRFLGRIGTAWPADAAEQLAETVEAALGAARLRPAIAAWWRPRLRRIALWAAGAERDRRSEVPLAQVASEVPGLVSLAGPAGPFELRGRADRIERRRDGRLAILDYKTGAPPTEKQVGGGWAPQLPLQAAMAARGGYGDALAGPAAELTYWHLSGGHQPGEARRLFRKDDGRLQELAEAMWVSLCERVAQFDDPAMPYLSQPHPGQVPRFSDYAQLARVAEWAALEDE